MMTVKHEKSPRAMQFDQEYLDHVELMADQYIAQVREPNFDLRTAYENFRNLCSPWFIKGLIERNRQTFMLKAGLRQIEGLGKVCGEATLEEAQDIARRTMARAGDMRYTANDGDA